MDIGNFVALKDVKLKGGFWQKRYELNKNVSIESVKRRFEDSGRFNALRFNYLKTGGPLHCYFDSDVAKWIEGVAYVIEHDRESMKENEEFIDELVLAMEGAQRDNGYLNSYYQQICPDKIFTERGGHELYCCGHLIEAAIAYHRATGKRKLLDIMERYCDCVERAFITEKTAAFVTPGHEEIELALFKLYRYTGNEKYRKMAEFFLENRGRHDKGFPMPETAQDDVDIYNLREANGHGVRALYYYSGIADMAKESEDERLLESLDAVFSDIVGGKLYITGGVGSTRRQESFTVPYDLPNMTAYSESCGAIAFIMFAMRMRRLRESGSYGNVIERIMYNNLLSSTSLCGKKFFYENPLEIALEEHGRQRSERWEDRERLAITERVEVFECSCCPPNINRWIAEHPEVICFDGKEHAFVEQYISSDVSSAYGNIRIRENYVIDGKASIECDNYRANLLKLRKPEWCDLASVTLNGKIIRPKEEAGYLIIPTESAFSIELDFHIAPVFIAADPRVRADAGRVALTYGPLVYCLEGVDNGQRLNRLSVKVGAEGNARLYPDFHGILSIELDGKRELDAESLYIRAAERRREDVRLKFIPYFAFANRGKSDMLVWVREA